MSFQIERREPIRDGVARVVRERLNEVLDALKHDDELSDLDVHTARRRLKQVRATLRLFRRDLGNAVFKRENRTHRDSARPLSALRDATALLACFDNLAKRFSRRLLFQDVASIRTFLVDRRRDQRARSLCDPTRIRRIERDTRRARKRVTKWQLSSCRKRSIAKGLRTIYRDGRRAMRTASRTPTDTALHEWRKRTKDLRYALDLVRCHAHDSSAAISMQAHALTDLLGDDHDLATLRAVLKAERVPGAYRVLPLLNEWRMELQRASMELGRSLYQEKPRRFLRRVVA